MALALFDLDHTLLTGDTDVLWCDFLVAHGLLPATQRERNAEMEARYAAGSVSAAEFCGFYVATLGGMSLQQWQPWLQRFQREQIEPRIPQAARELVQRHREAGDTLVLTTATNRITTAAAARSLGFEHHLATEVELVGGLCTGRVLGVPNMREGKLQRLREWLPQHGLHDDALSAATFYSDSINDLPLLEAVGHPVAVDPGAALARVSAERGWPVLRLRAG